MKTQKLTLAGSIITALMASSCCWLPFVLLAFGLSGTALSSVLSQYRIPFLVVTYIFLLIAFYFAYKPKTEDCCSSPKTQKINLKQINRIMLWITTIIITAIAFLPIYIHLLPFSYTKVKSVKPLCDAGNEDLELISKIEDSENFLLKKSKCCDKDDKNQ